MEIIRVLNPKVLESAYVRAFIEGSLPSDSVAVPAGMLTEEVAAGLTSKNHAFFLGTEDGVLKSCALVFAPDKIGLAHPQILHFYNNGSPAMRRALVAKCVDFAKEKGHMSLWAINQTGRPDSVWARMFRWVGPASRVGGIMRVDFKDAQ